MDVRDTAQREAKEKWLSSNRKNTIIAATGAGKSKIALDIIKELNPQTILLLTNAVNLRDANWKAEFEKFGVIEYWDRTVSKTYQATYARDWANELRVFHNESKFDLIILDEIDFACTVEYGRCLNKAYTFGRNVLGLTGFITEEKREILSDVFPICYEITAEQMQEGNLLNKSEFIFIEYPLLKERTVEQKMKKGGMFKTSENDVYGYWDKKFQAAMIAKSALEKKYRMLQVDFEKQKDWQSSDWNFKFTAAKRKSVLHNSLSSARVVYKLLERIHSIPNNKVLIFSTNIKQCNLFPNPYHGEREVHTYTDLNNGSIDTLSVVKKITRGVNLVGVNYLIRESYDGSEEMFFQSHGRLLRLRPGQVAKYIILVPMFEQLARHSDGVFRKTMMYTQAAKWAEKMMGSFNAKDVRYIKLDETYQLKDGIEL